MKKTGNLKSYIIMKQFMIIISILLAFGMKAQNKSIKVEINPETVLMDNEFEVSFTIDNGEIKSFDAPAFKDFDLVGSPMTSSMMQIINGAVSSQYVYTYVLSPKNPGKFYIEPAFATLKDGTSLETQAIEVKVESNPDGVKQEIKRKNNLFITPRNSKSLEKLKPERKSYKI